MLETCRITKKKQDSNNAIFYFVISLKCNFVTLLRWYIRLQKYEKDFNLFVIVKMVCTSADKSQNEMQYHVLEVKWLPNFVVRDISADIL